MKKTLKFCAMMLAATTLMLVSCGKDPENPGNNNQDSVPVVDNPVGYNNYVGVYDVYMVTDSVGVDGDWMDKATYELSGKTEPDREGVLTVTLNENGDGLNMNFDIVIGGNLVQNYMATTAKLDDNGNLLLDNSETVLDNGTLLNFQYRIISESPMKFRVEMHTIIFGMDCGYLFNLTATKRA